MLGYVFALIAASLFAVRESLNKKLSQRTTALFIIWGSTLLSLPIFIVSLIFSGAPQINKSFWLVLPLAAVLSLLSSFLLVRAVQISPLSKTLPLLSFTPVMLVFTSWLMLHQMPSRWGLVGILLIVIGAYSLNAEKFRQGFKGPLRAIVEERGSLYALAVAVIWSITSNLDKLGIQYSSIPFYLLTVNFTVIIMLTAILAYQRQPLFSGLKKHFRWLISISVASSLISIFQLLAISRIIVPYVIAIKRGGGVLGGIILGKTIFKEGNFKIRLMAGLIMVAGIVIIMVVH
ncbi:MAG: EamA family transporter [Patescibacteria group bacterium]|jgi:drug/metabolite transporter (DMT)-like permease